MITPAEQLVTGEPVSMDPLVSSHDEFLTLVESHQSALRKVCWAYGRSPHDRDDLLQEMIVRLWSAFPRYDRSRPFSTWMYRVALNVAIDFRRRQRRWRRDSEGADDAAIQPPAVPDDAAKAEQLQELHELLDRQNDADRAILLLCLEGHSYREIGEVLGISETNVGTRLNRLKRVLRESVNNPERD